MVHDIAARLKLPENVERNVIQKLNDNGIYVVEPLKKASENEWTDLGLPLAVSKELKERILAIKEQGLTLYD